MRTAVKRLSHLIEGDARLGLELDPVRYPDLGATRLVFGPRLGEIEAQRNRRLARSLATDSVTATWQLSCLPSSPQYWRATPTECLPFFGMPVSSMIQARMGACLSIFGSTNARTALSNAASCQGALATKWCSDWCLAPIASGARRAAIGSTLFLSPGNNNPVQ